MKRFLTVFGFVALSATLVSAFAWRTIPQTAFAPGEKIAFEIGWKAATAGEVTLRVQEKGTRKNRPAYKLICDASTNAAIDMVFKVRDRFESWMDAQALCSLGFARRIEEGGYVKMEDIFIDPATGTFKSRSARPKKSAAASIDQGNVPAYVQDPISTLYYLRAQKLKAGQSVDVQVMNGTDVHNVRFQVRRNETIKTVIGTLPCVVVEPLFKTDQGYAPHPKATAFIWFTDDSRHIPVKISAELPFGHIDATLSSFQAK